MSILVVAAHPDDEVLGCGGIMARASREGTPVDVCILTAGAPQIFPREQVERVRAECREACRRLGVREVHFLDFPAPRLDTVAIHEVADALQRLIAETTPEELYLPHRGDIHLDHQVAYHAGLIAARPIGAHKVRRVLCYETLSDTEWASPEGGQAFVPTVFVEVGDHVDDKIEAMGAYESQLKPDPHSRSASGIRALARFRGATVGVQYAEAFMLVREIHGAA